jgi:hypothetical protein
MMNNLENIDVNVQQSTHITSPLSQKIRRKAETPKFMKKKITSSPSVSTFMSTNNTLMSPLTSRSECPKNSNINASSTPKKTNFSSNSTVSSVSSCSQSTQKSSFSTSTAYLNEIGPALKEKMKAERAQKTEEDKQNVQALKLKLAKEKELARQSLAKRLIVSHKQEEIDLRAHRNKLDKMHSDLQSKKEDVIHMRSVKEEAKQRSRMSIAFRLDSWRMQKALEEGEHTQKKKESELEYKMREIDYQSIREAKEKLKFWKMDAYTPEQSFSSFQEEQDEY